MTALVWVTGASSGLGRALVDHCPLPDATVVDVSRSGGSGAAAHLALDLAKPSSWTALRDDVRDRVAGARPDRVVLVHAAAVLDPVGPAGTVDLDAYGRLAVLDAAAPQAVGAAFLEALDVAGHAGPAHLVQLSSGAASKPYEGWSAYCAGKAAVEMWVRTVGEEQQRRRAAGRPARTVLAVAPGVVATSMQEHLRELDEERFPAVERFRALHRDGQLAPPADAARALWSLVDLDRDDAPGTGAVLDLRDL